jgi:hypothetical protein
MIVRHVVDCRKDSDALEKLRSGDAEALARAVAGCIRLWYAYAGTDVLGHPAASHVAALSGTPQAGLLAAANDLRDLLAQTPHGRQALRNLGLQPVLQHVESE